MKKTFQYLWQHKIYTIIIIIIALISWGTYVKNNKQTNYLTDNVSLGTIVDNVSESGNVMTEGQANITSSIEGIVEQIRVSNNDHVYIGQALFTIKSISTELDKQTAQSSYISAQNTVNTASQTKNSYAAAVETAKKTLYDAQTNYTNIKRWFILQTKNTSTGRKYTQTDLDGAAATLSAAEENLAVAEQRYNDADLVVQGAQAAEEVTKTNLDNKTSFTVTAPTGGTVSNISINPGDRIGGSTLTTSTTSPNMIISKSKTLIFKTQINEIDIPKLKVNQVATVTVDSIKNQTFNGRIDKIDEIGTNTQGVISYGVYFTIDNQDSAIKPGMSGSINVETQKRENVLTVINSAIKPYQGGKAVQIRETKTVKGKSKKVLTYIPVKVGLKGLERTEILEGISNGQEVIIAVDSSKSPASLLSGGK